MNIKTNQKIILLVFIYNKTIELPHRTIVILYYLYYNRYFKTIFQHLT